MKTEMGLSVFLGCLALTMVVYGQDQSGFISIDCGIAEGSSYNDATTKILYTWDATFVDTGINENISLNFMSQTLPRQLSTVRSFAYGEKNCYTLKPEQGRGNQYLIRASFMYGNYDSKDELPEFELYLGVEEWDSIKFNHTSHIVIKEIIHIPSTDYIDVCLINTGSGTPFISVLELRHLDNSSYITKSGSLLLYRRYDVGSISNQTVRYEDDVYDRIWEPYSSPYWGDAISAPFDTDRFSANNFKPPSMVMRTAVIPKNGSKSLDFDWVPDDTSQKFYIYMHFAEVEELQDNQLRKFDISLNDDHWRGPIVPPLRTPTTANSTFSVSGTDKMRFSIFMTNDSTLPPILNALEIYIVKEFLQSPTHQNEVEAIRNIKLVYGIEIRNWQGDPCYPEKYSWDGLNCSYNRYDSPSIISLNLSASNLTGNIASSFYELKSLQKLDLSNNGLTGTVPDFLSQLPLLKTLNLSGNKLIGSIPSALIERSKNGSLSLSVEGNQGLCQKDSCKEKKNVVIPVVASIASCLVLITALAILWGLKRRKKQAMELVVKPNEEDEALEPKNRHFTYSEILRITNNFQKVLGKGGFGTVYGGSLADGTQVAVKMLSSSSTQGSKQFRTEAQLLTKVHHRNLTSLIGYCNESLQMGLIYEYMANGNLEEHLSEKSAGLLGWEQRLRIAVDAAQALEYLHNGCKPPIIHRDVKTSNILLNDKLQAKVSDFGVSRFMPLDSETEVSTAVVGTPGYLDPEYYVSRRLNEKSDVYAFGIVLLELITGRRAVVKSHGNINISQWVQPMLERGEIRSIIDPRLRVDFDINSVWKAVETAMACVPPSSIQRPTMSQVLVELKECLDIEIARERTGKMKENHETTCNSSMPIDLQSSMGPSAR